MAAAATSVESTSSALGQVGLVEAARTRTTRRATPSEADCALASHAPSAPRGSAASRTTSVTQADKAATIIGKVRLPIWKIGARPNCIRP